MLKVVKIVSIVAVLIVTGVFTFLQFKCSSNINYIEIGTLIILALTLIAIIFYVADTHTIAKASEATYHEIISQQRKQQNKSAIWRALEQQTGSLTPEQIAEKTHIPVEELNSLLLEMVQNGSIFLGPFPGTFTRYKIEYKIE